MKIHGIIFDMDGTITAPYLDFATMKAKANVGDVDLIDYLRSATGKEYERKMFTLKHADFAIARSREAADVLRAKSYAREIEFEQRPNSVLIVMRSRRVSEREAEAAKRPDYEAEALQVADELAR